MLTLENISPILERIVSFINEGVIIADIQGRVLYHNPSASELLSFPGDYPIEHISQINSEGLRLCAQLKKIDATPYKSNTHQSGKFEQFTLETKTAEGIRSIEINTGVITLLDNHTQLRLLLLSDCTDHLQLEAVLNNSHHHGVVTNDPNMQAMLARIQQVAGTQATVLLQGESGTGKTQLARMIHQLSPRKAAPFIEVNCAAIPETLIESELFGHIKGAFTGATQDRAGRFQSAEDGTLFLDEISELPLHLQAKLLKAVQEQRFEPVGSDTSTTVNVRVIAASNKNLRDLVETGQFRADLYYRIAVIPLELPPLRDRPGDIPLLIQHFIRYLSERGYSADIKLRDDAKRILMNYLWPGNVRELQNAIEHGIICAIDGEIHPQSLPLDISRSELLPSSPNEAHSDEQRHIKMALSKAKGNRSMAAELLGIDRTTLWRRMNKLGMN
jgi:transcriptional regulator with PAS, ATPase and Fis domain